MREMIPLTLPILLLLLTLLNPSTSFTLPPLSSTQNIITSRLSAGQTLYDKILSSHLLPTPSSDTNPLIYIDRHIVHEVTSPQAFEGLTQQKRAVRRRDLTLLTCDHNVPTEYRGNLNSVESFIKETASRTQVLELNKNAKLFNLQLFGLADTRQGIVHIISPEQGFTLPLTTLVCGDSHTATHGAFGCLAFGIGTSEVESVLATQVLGHKKAANFEVRVTGKLGQGVSGKDVVLHICKTLGTAGGTGSVIEFTGSVIEGLSMEGRMSLSNMAIEAGARAGLVAPDWKTYQYMKGRPMAPDVHNGEWEKAIKYWDANKSDKDAVYDKVVIIKGEDIEPSVTWGTSPQDVVGIQGSVPMLSEFTDERKPSVQRSLDYINLKEGMVMKGIEVDKVFIGSCTNGRIEDIRSAAAVAYGRQVSDRLELAMVVPGSGLVKKQAEAEGLDVILKNAGFQWREPGCSMCLAMNNDKLLPGERCASTSNRNFEGRQGSGGRTHLMSPSMAAAAAIAGGLADVRDYPFLGDKSEDPRNLDESFTGVQDRGSDVFNMKMTVNAGAVINRGLTKTNTAESSAKSSGGNDDGNKFGVLKARSAGLDIQNIDTDMIIPKEFLKTIKRSGLGFAAFADLRYENADAVAIVGAEVAIERSDFILNQPGYKSDTKILITGDNFGCGSSREHAPWAIKDMGISCVISTSFADIFYGNCFNNGILPIKLPRKDVEVLLKNAKDAKNEVLVDLEKQQVSIPNTKYAVSFEMDPFRKKCLLEGLDKIGLTLELESYIHDFESKRSKECPWLDGVVFKVGGEERMYPDAGIWGAAKSGGSVGESVGSV